MAVKESIDNEFCLFHQKSGCSCITPVTNIKDLKTRLEHSIKLNNINNYFEKDPEEKAEREAQSELWRARLEQLESQEKL